MVALTQRAQTQWTNKSRWWEITAHISHTALAQHWQRTPQGASQRRGRAQGDPPRPWAPSLAAENTSWAERLPRAPLLPLAPGTTPPLLRPLAQLGAAWTARCARAERHFERRRGGAAAALRVQQARGSPSAATAPASPPRPAWHALWTASPAPAHIKTPRSQSATRMNTINCMPDWTASPAPAYRQRSPSQQTTGFHALDVQQDCEAGYPMLIFAQASPAGGLCQRVADNSRHGLLFTSNRLAAACRLSRGKRTDSSAAHLGQRDR